MSETICSYHGDIIRLAKKIKQLTILETTNKQGGIVSYDCGNSRNIETLHKCASEIIELAKKAKTAGVHMENRLQVYRDGIENMGFIREKRKKYERK